MSHTSNDNIDASILHLQNPVIHKNKESYVEALMDMFGSKFNIESKDLYTVIDVYRVLENGLTRDILLKIVRELKVIDSYKSKLNNSNAPMSLTYTPNLDDTSKLSNNNTTNESSETTLLSDLLNNSINADSYLPITNTFQSQSPSVIQKPIENKPVNITNISTVLTQQPIIKETKKPVIQFMPNKSPTTHILTFPQLKMIKLEGIEKLNYAGTYISASVCHRYNLHEMPYLLLIVNKKYKIPVTLVKQNTNFYAHNKYKGPINVTSLEIELLDFMNNPLSINIMPTEIFHILFESATT
jgi:hypothetical protein